MPISTRLHGVIDYAAATLLGALATRQMFSAPLRRTLGLASIAHAVVSTQTDYEAGLTTRLTMRQHLGIDTAMASALCAGGLLLRRRPAFERLLLVALGCAELGVIAYSSASPSSGPGQGAGPIDRLMHDPALPDEQVGYPPLDTPKAVAPDLFVVDSLLSGLLGRVLAARMTVIRLPNDDLVLHSPTQFTPRLKSALETLGRIRHLVAPNTEHWVYLSEWQRHCDDVQTWISPGLRKRTRVVRGLDHLGHDLPEVAPAEWGGVIELETINGGLGFTETALFHVPTRTLVLSDLALNLEIWKLPVLIRPVVRTFGSMAPDGMPPPYVRAVVRMGGSEARAAMRRLLDRQPERVIFSHGRWFESDGTIKLRRSLRWLLD